MKGTRLRIGLIGAGRIGTNHARILSEHPDVDSLLITDAIPSRAEALAGRIDIGEAVHLDRLLAESEGVVIASSTDTHAEMLVLAADAGVAAFCEKPIDLDMARTKEAVAAVEASGIVVQMGFQRRYDPAMRSIRDRVASGALGTPYLVRSQTHDPEPPPLDYIPHSGGIFKDCLIHDIDIVRYVTGQEVVSVHAAGTTVGHPDIAALDDVGTAAAMLEMSGGTIAQLSCLRLDPVGYDVRLEVFAPRGAVAAGWSDRTPLESTEPGQEPPANPIVTFWDRFDAAYRVELDAFTRVVRGEELPASNHHDAFVDLSVAEACDRSLAEGRTVLMEEVDH